MEKKRALWLNQIADFIGEYSRVNPGYSPHELSSNLEKKFSIRAAAANKLALLVQKEQNDTLMLAAIELNLTFNCNLACEYCFVHNKSPEDRMNFATAKEAIDLLIEHAYPNVTITLFGGEPLLEFDLIKEIVPYALERARQQGVTVGWAVTTNGTLITEEMLQFFAQHQINLLLSIDGGQENHDRYRRTKSGQGTWQQIIDSLPMIRLYQSWLGVRMTISAEAICSMRKDFTQLVEFGINQFIIAPAQGARCWSSDQIDQYSLSLAKIHEDYYALKRAGAAIFIEEFETQEVECSGWGCRAGATSLAVAPNGDISPCSKLLGLSDENGKCIVGNVHSGINYTLLEPFQNPIGGQPLRCKRCTHPCTGGCYAVNFEQTGDHFTPSAETCLFWASKQEISKLPKIM